MRDKLINSAIFAGAILTIATAIVAVIAILSNIGQEKAQAQPRPVFVPPFIGEEDDDFRGCLETEDCKFNEICHYGQCMGFDCVKDSDCPSGEYCFEGFCEVYGADDFVCRDDSDCFEDEWCWEGDCTTAGEETSQTQFSYWDEYIPFNSYPSLSCGYDEGDRFECVIAWQKIPQHACRHDSDCLWPAEFCDDGLEYGLEFYDDGFARIGQCKPDPYYPIFSKFEVCKDTPDGIFCYDWYQYEI